MSYQRVETQAVFDACCSISKQDIPQVEGVIDLVLLMLEELWPDIVENLVDIAVGRLGGVPEPLDSEEDSEAVEDFVLALVGALELRLGLVLPLEGQEIILAAVERLLLAGGVSIGAAVGLGAATAAGLPQLGLGDLEFSLRGRVQLRRQEIGDLIGEALTSAEPAGELIGDRLRQLLGIQTKMWLPFVVDQWAYRWFNVGTFEGAQQKGIKALVAFNNPPRGPDGKTTPFCFWVHKRAISIGRVRAQLDVFERAVRNNNIRLAIRAWPLLTTTDGSPTDFANFFLSSGLPPYHGRCRTVARPV